MKKTIRHSLKLVAIHFGTFFKRLYVFAFFWGMFALVSYGVATLIPVCLHRYLGMPHNVSMVIMKVLLTIAPILPTAVYAKLKEEDYNDEFSMDLCFAVWVITIVLAWWVI